MRKIIKKYGNSAIVVLNAEDMKAFKMKVGEVIEIDILTAKEIKERESWHGTVGMTLYRSPVNKEIKGWEGYGLGKGQLKALIKDFEAREKKNKPIFSYKDLEETKEVKA